MNDFKCSVRKIIDTYIESGRNIQSIKDFVEKNFELSEENIEYIVNCIQKTVIPNFNNRWKKSNRSLKIFKKTNVEWLNGDFCRTLPEIVKPLKSTTNRGRPCNSYESSSKSSKKRKNTSLCKNNGFDHIYGAYVQGLRSMGELEEAKIIELLRSSSKLEKKEILKNLEHSEKGESFDELEALSVFIDLDMTKAQYIYLRNLMMEKKYAVLPPYYKVQEAKKSCYLPPASLEVTSTYARVKSLQDLVDHTSTRILMIDAVDNKSLLNLTLYYKWGCDGSSGQSEYKQSLPEESSQISDANIFITSLVPIKLISEETGDIIWENPVCSSVRYCRPISIELCKETPSKTKEVVDNIEN